MGRTACTEPQCLYKGALYLYLLHFIPILISLNNFMVTQNSMRMHYIHIYPQTLISLQNISHVVPITTFFLYAQNIYSNASRYTFIFQSNKIKLKKY